jgi:hypothetical protein
MIPVTVAKDIERCHVQKRALKVNRRVYKNWLKVLELNEWNLIRNTVKF